MPDCSACKEDRKKVETIPYIVHESAMAREERHVKRLIAALVLAVVLLFGSNAAWLYVWQSYDFESYTIETSGENSNANYIGNDGDIYNGSTSFSEEEEEEERQR